MAKGLSQTHTLLIVVVYLCRTSSGFLHPILAPPREAKDLHKLHVRAWKRLFRRTSALSQASGLDEARNLVSLKDWALANGVILMPNVELVQDPDTKEWGVTITQNLIDQEAPVMSIPSSLILSSASVENLMIYPALANFGMEHYEPEFCLFWILLREHSKGKRSVWHPWIQSLPKSITTAIYFDDDERAYARKLGAGKFLDHQVAQWQAFQKCLFKIFPSYRFPLELQKWAYSVVLTRSWRTSFLTKHCGAIAILAPMADMFNHRAAATVQVRQQTAEDPVRVVPKNFTTTSELFLNYGYAEHPDRFMMIFGFCDTSSSFICADTILELLEGDEDAVAMGLYDSSKVTFDTTDGRPSATLKNVLLYKIMKSKIDKNPSDERLLSDMDNLKRSCLATGTLHDDQSLQELHQRYHQDALDPLRHEVENILTDRFGPVPQFDAQDYSTHPRLELLVQYHNYMRSIYEKVHRRLTETA